ncbi:N-acyl-D-amino-acid deacylase family protein [Gulosibacter bifidus]|uniref:Amidohydrolase family protein n=1 Tax=Gulosibacter bifidus TaxID=272239 RepID=A0ABW5RHN3_9MICO|nr:amidohydrolase family protein [Gulosibacter bifidus]
MATTLIDNATIIDGTGSSRFHGAIEIDGNRIKNVWRGQPDGRNAAQADQRIDAQGYVLAPGFIDLHSHADFTIHGGPAAETQLVQGVTTALVGNCGSSPFPIDSIAQIKRDKSHFDPEFIGDWVDAAGYVQATDEVHPGINLVLQLGLSSLRHFVVGDEERAATDAEILEMQQEIRRAAEAGVRGFSSGLIYAPGSFASKEEMIALVSTAAECGLLYSTHMRNESGKLLEAVAEAIDTAERAGARLEISHLKAMGPENHGKPRDALQLVEEARDRNVDVTVDVYPYTASSTTLTSRLPSFALDGGKAGLLAQLADEESRAAIASGLRARFGRDVDPDGVLIASLAPAAGDRDYISSIGLSLTQIGANEGCSAEEAAMRVLEAHQAGVAIVNHAMADSDVEFILKHPLVAVASDGWKMKRQGDGRPHPRSFGTFVRVLGHYSRDLGIISLETAVKKMTLQPAERIGLSDRGQIRPGNIADLVLFDPERVTDTSTFDDPWQLAVGIDRVWIAGKEAVVDGKITGERHGRIL